MLYSMKNLACLCAGILALTFQFTQSAIAAGEQKIRVFVSIQPQRYFVKRIGDNRVVVNTLLKPGSSPATYQPSARQMVALSKAKLFFRIGVPFEEAFLPKIQNLMKSIKVVDTRKGIKLRTMKAHHHAEVSEHHEKHDGNYADTENDEDHHHHHHGGKDPHIWLSPHLVKIQARTIADAMIKIDPAGREIYERNYKAFADDLDALDAKLAKALAPVKGKTFLVFHPAWGYFADAYGLQQESIEIEGKEPSARQLAKLLEEAKADDVKIIFVQPQFSRASARKIAEAIGGAVVPIDPLASDYIKNLETVAKIVGDALAKQK